MGNLRCQSVEVFSLELVRFPEKTFPGSFLPAFWVPKGRWWERVVFAFHSVQAHRLYCLHSDSLSSFNCACGPQSRHCLFFWTQRRPFQLFAGIKMGNGEGSECLLSRLSTSFPYFISSPLSTLLPSTCSCIYNS